MKGRKEELRYQDSDCPASGFTLVEILVVIIIITILASIVTVNVLRKPGEARTAAVSMQIDQLKTAVNIYRTELGTIPSQAQGLDALVSKPVIPPIPKSYPSEPYLDTREVPLDPWGNDFIYLSPGRNGEPFEIISYGSDGEKGGSGEAADVSSSEI